MSEKLRMTRSTKVWMILLPLLLGFAGFWLARAIYRSTSEQARITQLETENAELKSSLEKLRANVPTPSGPTDASSLGKGKPAAGSGPGIPIRVFP